MNTYKNETVDTVSRYWRPKVGRNEAFTDQKIATMYFEQVASNCGLPFDLWAESKYLSRELEAVAKQGFLDHAKSCTGIL